MLDGTIKLALETIQINKQAIIFVPSRSSAEKTAEEISKLTTMQYPHLEKSILEALSTPTTQCRRLAQYVKKGIAFHHAGLLAEQRELIEDEFKKGTIKVICATPTLAAGISFPAFRVIIKSLKRYSGNWGMDWIPVLEYFQMAGRAGRPEYEPFGEAISIAKNEAEKEEIYQKYVRGEPEEIYSKLAAEPVLRTYLLSLISTGIIYTKKSMKDFFRQTFWAHQFGDMQKLEAIMEKMLQLLEEWELVKVGGKKEEFMTASSRAQNEITLQPTLLGKRVSELYIDPLTAKHLLDCLGNITEKKAFSLLQAISHTLEMRPLLRIKTKENEFIQEELVKNYDLLLEPEPSPFEEDYDNFLASIKTALFFQGWIEEKEEDYLLEKYDIRPGEIRVKVEIAKWLLYALEELAKIKSENKELLREITQLRMRVQYGAKEELLPLLRLKGIGRVRARRLVSNSIKDLGDIKKVDITTLTQILGRMIAEEVKKQVGEDISEEISPGKRKGQLSIQKF